MRVQRPRHHLGFDRARERERRHLPQRVNAGIRASRANHRHRSALELAQRVFEEPLNRHTRGLTLPADELGSVVCDSDLEGCHFRVQISEFRLISD